jgi:hypothetical protein
LVTASGLKDFPIYPGATLQEKIDPIPCPSEHSGFDSCGETLYVFNTDAPSPSFYDFYHSNNNGWVMSGGAGEVAVRLWQSKWSLSQDEVK